MREAVIVSTARTPIGRAARGSLNITHGAEMAAHAITHALSRAGVEGREVEEVTMGVGYPEGATGGNIARAGLLRATRWDVGTALGVAGTVNIGLLLLAAANLRGVEGTDTIEGAHAAIQGALGGGVAVVFAIGLLASGLASTSVGCYAGAAGMEGLIHRRVPLLLRRAITLVPALLLLALGADPTWTLVVSQVVLSFGIPFAAVPLVRLNRDRGLLGAHANGPRLQAVLVVVVALVVVLNLALLVLLATGA